jgi:hypothetical protein
MEEHDEKAKFKLLRCFFKSDSKLNVYFMIYKNGIEDYNNDVRNQNERIWVIKGNIKTIQLEKVLSFKNE